MLVFSTWERSAPSGLFFMSGGPVGYWHSTTGAFGPAAGVAVGDSADGLAVGAGLEFSPDY